MLPLGCSLIRLHRIFLSSLSRLPSSTLLKLLEVKGSQRAIAYDTAREPIASTDEQPESTNFCIFFGLQPLPLSFSHIFLHQR
jgi:hypothetical protein